jgi:catechol 2,3-dioxygenase-like lactoylglutathione lyase family enzyme
MSRVQLSINVSDFDAAVAFYSRLFGPPAKLHPGYANFAVDDPPLKLVLNSPGNGPGGTINPSRCRGQLDRGGYPGWGPAGCRWHDHRTRTGRGLLLRTARQGVGA